jgi:glucose/arabinose dehydrogenase
MPKPRAVFGVVLGVTIALALLVVLAASIVGWSPLARGGIHLDEIELPEGFRIAVYTSEVEGARSLALGPRGTLFVGTRGAGRVYAVRDEDGDGRAEKVRVLLDGLDTPNGVAVKDGALYVAEISRILRYDDIEQRLDAPPDPVVVHAGLPEERQHGWKFIAFGPDRRLYVPVGAPGNNVLSKDPRFASILRESADGKKLEVFAHGVRNTVGFDWHPQTRDLWFTDNGRDWMGDDLPPDELNHAPRAGLHFAYPFAHGKGIPDPEFHERRPRRAFTPPVVELGPHVAALGMRFYTGKMFPERWRGAIFIAEHGSWNRTVPVGYRLTTVRFGPGGAPLAPETFAAGWLGGVTAWGRPVDVQVAPDGALLVSDDRAGAVYRITHGGAPGGARGARPR